MRLLVFALLLLTPVPVYGQDHPTEVVTPTWMPEKACWQSVPCEAPCLQPPQVATMPCTPQPVQPQPVIHYELRSKALCWVGAALEGGAAALIIAATTWGQASEATSYVALPCGTDPYFAQHQPIAPCKVSGPLLVGGLSLAGTGATLMIYGSQKVAIGADGHQVLVRVKF